MPAQLRVLRRRIRSSRNIAQITKAQETVATSRISKAQARVENSRPYVEEFTNVLTQASKAAATDHPLLVARENVTRVGVLVITSDRGLAGGYNANVQRLAMRRVQEIADAGQEPMLFVVGRKGRDFFRFRGREVAQSWTGFSELPAYENAVEVADSLAAAFLAGGEGTIEGPEEDEDPPVVAPEEVRGLNGVDELHVVFTAFSSMLSQTPEARQIAPLSLDELEGDSDGDSDGEGSRTATDGRRVRLRARRGAALRRPAPEVPPDADLRRAPGRRGVRVRGAAPGHEGRHRQRQRAHRGPDPRGQPGPPGPDHAGNQRDRRWCRRPRHGRGVT